MVCGLVAIAVLITSTGGTLDTTPGTTRTPAAPAADAAPFTGGGAGCTVNDPTTSGCVTLTTAHALDEIAKKFGGYRKGPTIGSAGCWDAHAWNPTSDHPKGRACDFFPAGVKAGTFASGVGLTNGWALAHWLRANAAALRVRYLIWQGRIWQVGVPDAGGWGTKYTGGGIYDGASPTGGHFDHVHASFRT